jgi:hypothetical protein
MVREKFTYAHEENWLTKQLVEKTLRDLKPKRCFGFERVFLVFLRDVASELSEIITKLMIKVLEEEKTSEQCKVARILPLFKKREKEKTENYRPISNLCSITKVYEKRLLHRFQEIQEKEKTDLIGSCQHGFKKNFSTETAFLEIQTKLSNDCDNGDYAALALLDLTAAFDVVDRILLKKRLQIMGIPSQLINILDNWLSNRLAYCKVNKINSEFFEVNFGTIQGSILGPMLFALFISPLADITTPTTCLAKERLRKKHSNAALKKLKSQ